MKRVLSKQRVEELDEVLKTTQKRKVTVTDAKIPNMRANPDIDLEAIRRAKVRELKAAGFSPEDISTILSKGIVDSEGTRIVVESSLPVVRQDIRYLEQEYMATDENILLRRGEIVDKLNYIYNKAFIEYTNAIESHKNQYLNTALAAIRELKSIYGLDFDLAISAAVSNIQHREAEHFTSDMERLNDKERNEILTTISKILSDSEQG